MKVLLLEDDVVLSEIICEFLHGKKYEVVLSYDGFDAEEKIASIKFDLLLFDVNVPNINGFELLKKLKNEHKKTPAIFITAIRDSVFLKKAFDVGVDDYIKKPFELEELEARINNICRIYDIEQDSVVFIAQDILFYPDQMMIKKSLQKIQLKKKESSILHYLLKNKNRIISKEELVSNIYAYEEMPTDATIRTYIKNIRRIIGAKFIATIKGSGYRFDKI